MGKNKSHILLRCVLIGNSVWHLSTHAAGICTNQFHGTDTVFRSVLSVSLCIFIWPWPTVGTCPLIVGDVLMPCHGRQPECFDTMGIHFYCSFYKWEFVNYMSARSLLEFRFPRVQALSRWMVLQHDFKCQISRDRYKVLTKILLQNISSTLLQIKNFTQSLKGSRGGAKPRGKRYPLVESAVTYTRLSFSSAHDYLTMNIH